MPNRSGSLALLAFLVVASVPAGADGPASGPATRVAEQDWVAALLPYRLGPGVGATLWASFSAAYAEGPPTHANATLAMSVHECRSGALVERWSRTVPLSVPGEHHEPLVRLGTAVMTQGFLLASTLSTTDGWTATEREVVTFVAASECFG